MTSQTIQKRYVDRIAPQMSNIRSFTEDSYFQGEPCKASAVEVLAHAVRFDAKVSVDKVAGKGRIRHHSNYWLTFDFAS